jgi:hypothetical protein
MPEQLSQFRKVSSRSRIPMAESAQSQVEIQYTVKLFKMGQRFRKEIIKDFIKFTNRKGLAQN